MEGWRAAPNGSVSFPSQTSKRARRFSLVRIMTAASRPKPRPPTANSRQETPAVKSTAATIALITMTVPRS